MACPASASPCGRVDACPILVVYHDWRGTGLACACPVPRAPQAKDILTGTWRSNTLQPAD